MGIRARSLQNISKNNKNLSRWQIYTPVMWGWEGKVEGVRVIRKNGLRGPYAALVLAHHLVPYIMILFSWQAKIGLVVCQSKMGKCCLLLLPYIYTNTTIILLCHIEDRPWLSNLGSHSTMLASRHVQKFTDNYICITQHHAAMPPCEFQVHSACDLSKCRTYQRRVTDPLPLLL